MENSSQCARLYLIAATPEEAQRFARKKRLARYVVVERIEDVPREMKLCFVLVGMRTCHKHPDYELLFGGGYMEQFQNRILYDYEVT